MLIGLVCKKMRLCLWIKCSEELRVRILINRINSSWNHARLRPILMTLRWYLYVPIALASGAGAEWKTDLVGYYCGL
jgi:multidrug efflux pump subunit AcrB